MSATPATLELSGRQRFELAILADDLTSPHRKYEESLADVIRYVAAEGITFAHFSSRDKEALRGGYLAALLVEQPETFHLGEAAGRALALAGFTPGDAPNLAAPSLN